MNCRIFSAVCMAAISAGVGATAQQRLTLGGYGEAVMTRNFYSDAWQRYTYPDRYASDKSHGRFDIPHFVINLGYDFGGGWTLGSEIEFEHGGTGSSVELEADETGEYETEIEMGGEVALEQFWLQKSFSPALKLRAGMIIVPVGLTNAHHLPTEYFTAYRQEGENTVFPCTWHEPGIEILGTAGAWSYELMFLPGLDSDRFGTENFIQGGAGSPYEFNIANNYAGAFRIDNRFFKGLRMGVSGYYGASFGNSLTKNSKYSLCRGEVMIGSADFRYDRGGFIAQGVFDWAHLNDSAEITAFNKNNMSTASPSPHNAVGSDAIVGSIEAGYDIFRLLRRGSADGERLYIFAHYEYYDSMFKVADGVLDYTWCGRHRVAAGLNWYPMEQIAVKAEWSKRYYVSPYNDEPSVSLGIVFSGWFER